MLIKNNANKTEFLEEIEGKKLYCYGAGKVFKDFLKLYPQIDIYSVVDRSADILKDKFENIKFITPGQFLKECEDKNSVLLITCFDYVEIQEELKKTELLDELSCYVYYIMQEKDGIKERAYDLNKYQLTEFRYQDCMAGQKAPADVTIIASKLGYEPITLNKGTVTRGMMQTKRSWEHIAENLKENSYLILQLPLLDDTEGLYKILDIKNKKNIKIIGIVHDINIVRGNPTEYDYRQYKILNEVPDVLIVHNIYMAKMLVDRGFDSHRLISLDIFDYLISDYKEIKESEGIVIAGNLIESKAAYVYQINKIDNVTFNLFGANYNERKKFNNINYFGAFLPDELIKNLQGKYGLVWDGASLDTCSGHIGEYLKINNPHKLSLYLAVGLPVIIWTEAAEAEFVKRENVGITVNSLYELPEKLVGISDCDYNIMKANANKIGKSLRNGEYMTRALKKAENKIKEMRLNE